MPYFLTSNLFVVFMFALDIVFIFMSIVIKPLLFLYSKISGRRNDNNLIEDKEEWFFKKLFSMTKKDVEGFRRARSIH